MDKLDVNLLTIGKVENIQLFIDKEILSSQQKIGFRDHSSEKSLVYDADKLCDLLGELKIQYEVVDFNATSNSTATPLKSSETVTEKVQETGRNYF